MQVAGLLRCLARRSELRLSAVVLNAGRLAQELVAAGVAAKVIPEAETSFFRIASQSRAFLEERKVRILHSHRYKENLLAAWLHRRLPASLVVRTQHGLPEPFSGLRGARHRLIGEADRFAARRADRVIAVTGDIRAHWARVVSADKVVAVPNGIEVERVRPSVDRAQSRAALGLEPQHLVLGTAGRLEPVKRLDLFLHTAQQILNQEPRARFVIAGEGSELDNLRALARSLGVEQRISFLGHRDDIYNVMQTFDVLLLTSDHEGLPMVLLEALCLGVSVASRRVGGIPEVIADGEQGLLLDSSDPVEMAARCLSLLADPARRARMAEAGRRRVLESFSMENTAARVAELYFSLLRS
ncbi:MAG: glycosyltransferase family 4 protein [Acidobacteria bacterium]|nr:glycosyltransferase family 4 protein [Acidobacteriota bacterium]